MCKECESVKAEYEKQLEQEKAYSAKLKSKLDRAYLLFKQGADVTKAP